MFLRLANKRPRILSSSSVNFSGQEDKCRYRMPTMILVSVGRLKEHSSQRCSVAVSTGSVCFKTLNFVVSFTYAPTPPALLAEGACTPCMYTPEFLDLRDIHRHGAKFLKEQLCVGAR